MNDTTKSANPLRIEPATGWAYNDTSADRNAGLNIWREVTEDFYMESLEVMPPMDWNGGATFLVMEPMTHTADDAIYMCLTKCGGRCFARELPRKQRRAMVAELEAHVAATISNTQQPTT